MDLNKVKQEINKGIPMIVDYDLLIKIVSLFEDGDVPKGYKKYNAFKIYKEGGAIAIQPDIRYKGVI